MMTEGKVTQLIAALSSRQFKTIEPHLIDLDEHLTLRSYIIGYTFNDADARVWSAIRSNAIAHNFIKTSTRVNLSRWFTFIEQSQPELIVEKSLARAVQSKSGASYNISLQDAEVGKVVTRFCPEPSGYLHIGHAKAALMNDYFAHDGYHGKLILRFDDTNPSKEKHEYEQSIAEDIKLLGITPDHTSYTSDHFQSLHDCCVRLIKAGLAYADDTDQMTMRDERMHGKASARRDRPVEENIELFANMIAGIDERHCIRAKISVDSPNKALRDPVIYRSNSTPHVRTGTFWKTYPTYDFACPLVDSIEGVTHALRSTEFADRNAQYQWFLKHLGLRKVHIWDFGRLNLKRTFLSKRKLAKLVDAGKVCGWDDPRMPTVRGVHRRGMTIPALREFILKQGPSKSVNLMDWTIFWNTNKKMIDPVAPRYTAIDQHDMVRATITSQSPLEAYAEDKPRHSKNAALGMKKVAYSGSIILEQDDAKLLKQDEEVTLMAWGNAIARKINRRSFDVDSPVIDVELELHLEGDFKKTEKKITWLSTEGQNLVPATLLRFDYLLTKDKLEKDDNFEDFLTETTEFRTQEFCEAGIAECKKGNIVQLERKGYYRVDVPYRDGEPMVLFHIPTGKKDM